MNVYVNCGGDLMKFESKEKTMDFFEDCILMSEGSEKERYTNIYFYTKIHLKDNKRCFTDGTEHIYTSNIEPSEISQEDENLLIQNFNIDKTDLLRFKAINYLSENNNRIYQSTLDRYDNIDELYNDYILKSNEVSFYYIDKKDKIVCIDATALPPENYWVEEFPLEDYEYANDWLGQDLEYSNYLEMKKKDNLEL